MKKLPTSVGCADRPRAVPQHRDPHTMLAICGAALMMLFAFQNMGTAAEPGFSNRHEAAYAVQRDGDSTTWLLVDEDSGTQRSYVEFATGLNHLDSEAQWRASEDLIEIQPDGSAAALHGQQKVWFAPNLNAVGSIEVVTRSGQSLKSHVLGLFLYNANTGESVQIGTLKDSVGELLPPNQILYKDAFEGTLADVRFTVTKSAFESDVILKAAPPDPRRYGMNPKTTRLEVWTEFVDPPEPQARPRYLKVREDQDERRGMLEPDLVDETLDFGDLIMPEGKAFTAEKSARMSDKNAAKINLAEDRSDSISVGKRWLDMKGRKILIEAVDWTDVDGQFDQTPAVIVSAEELDALKERVTQGRQISAVPSPGTATGSIQLASIPYRPAGVVIDYIATMPSGGYNFQSGLTYLITGSAYIGSGVTFGPGCVIKFSDNAYLLMYGSVYCEGTSSDPSILTSVNDDLFGETIPGSTGMPDYTASKAVWVYYVNTGWTFSGMKIRWAETAFRFEANQGLNPAHRLMNVVIQETQNGIVASNCNVELVNFAVCNVLYPYSGDVWSNNPPYNYPTILSDPTCGDQDQDGLPDVWELQFFATVGGQTGADDSDGDGLTNLEEYNHEQDLDPSNADMDGDGLEDGLETALGLDPESADSDSDNLPDAWELGEGFDPKNPSDGVIIVDFSTFSLSSHGTSAGEDVDPTEWEVLADGNELHLWGNCWKALDLGGLTPITENTVLRYVFRQGERRGAAMVSGVGFDTQTSTLTEATFFKSSGERTWGGYEYLSGSLDRWKELRIAVGREFAEDDLLGAYRYLVFANDRDGQQARDSHYAGVMLGGDADGDGFLNYEEYLNGTNPHYDNRLDSDRDGRTDVMEALDGTDPLDPNDVEKRRIGHWDFEDMHVQGESGNCAKQVYAVGTVPGRVGNAVAIESGEVLLYGSEGQNDDGPGQVVLTGLSKPDVTVSMRLRFACVDVVDGEIEPGDTIASAVGFMLRKPTASVDIGTSTANGQIDISMSPDGTFLIREQVGSSLTERKKLNPFTSATAIPSVHPGAGALPAEYGGQPFDVDQDGLLERSEPFTLKAVLSGTSLTVLINDQEVFSPITLTGSGTVTGSGNLVALFKNRLSSSAEIAADAVIDDLMMDEPSGTWGRLDGFARPNISNPAQNQSEIGDTEVGDHVYEERNAHGVYADVATIQIPTYAPVTYECIEPSGEVNVSLNRGSVRFWFKPYFSSGDYTYAYGRLLNVGSWSGDFTYGSWMLRLNPTQTELSFGTTYGGLYNLLFSYSGFNWPAGEWRQIVLTYSEKGSELYVDGQLVKSGAGITFWTGEEKIEVDGFDFGCNRQGSEQARGQYDELETFNYPLSTYEIARDYAQASSAGSEVDTDGDGMPDLWESLYGLNPHDSSDGMRTVIFDAEELESYGGSSQDIDDDNYLVSSDGSELKLCGNNWKAAPLEFSADADTCIRYLFRSTGEAGEIQGVGVDSQFANISNTGFMNAGTQVTTGWNQDYKDYSGTDWELYSIPVGSYWPDSYSYVTFGNDADAGQATVVYFRDIAVGGDADGDGSMNLEEFLFGTDPTNADTDGDGLSDGWELLVESNGNAPDDSDADGMPDFWEEFYGLDPQDAGDGMTSLILDPTSIQSYGGSSEDVDSEQFVITPDGLELRLEGNNWKAAPMEMSLRSDTYIRYLFRSDSGDSEIQGVGIENQTTSLTSSGFMNAGVQTAYISWNQTYRDYGEPDWKLYTIPIGGHWTGDYHFITFANDRDTNNLTGRALFRSVAVGGDLDGDGAMNLEEYQNGTDPTDSDSDDDGYSDGWELLIGNNGDDSFKTLDFREVEILSYGGSLQDVDTSNYEISADGSELHLWGNNWKAVQFKVNVRDHTVLRYEFNSDGNEPEIQSVGVDNTLSTHNNRWFKNRGIQTGGWTESYCDYVGPGWKQYVIPLRQHAVGQYAYLTFGNDNDTTTDASVRFRNICVGDDQDLDGVFDYEEAIAGTDPLTDNSLDSDYDGRSDVQERLDGTDPNDATDVKPVRLGYWRFNSHELSGEGGQRPKYTHTVPAVPSFNGLAAAVDSDVWSPLAYDCVERIGSPNINFRQGSIRFWYKPVFGYGEYSGFHGRLINCGGWTSDFSYGHWILGLTPYQQDITFHAGVGGSAATYFSTQQGINSWSAGEWHQVVLTYSPTQSKLYIDGQDVKTGAGVQHWPTETVRKNDGFNIGGDKNGNQKARGLYDELETFNYVLDATTIANDYQAAAPAYVDVFTPLQ